MQNYSMCGSPNEFKHFPHFCTKRVAYFAGIRKILTRYSDILCQNRVFFSITMLLHISITKFKHIYTFAVLPTYIG